MPARSKRNYLNGTSLNYSEFKLFLIKVEVLQAKLVSNLYAKADHTFFQGKGRTQFRKLNQMYAVIS